ncbi:MAG: hypothetical protein AB1440_11910 [Pseudomonadota bacterium]
MQQAFLTGSLEFLRRPFASNIKTGDRVLVLTDTRHDPRVWQAVMTILAELGADASLAMFEPRPADYYDPPAVIAEAMRHSDVNVLLASTGMLHSPANMKAMAAGVPTICLDGGMTLEMLQSGGITEDMHAMTARKHYLAVNAFGSDPKQCRVTSKHGTDFTYSVEKRIWAPRLPDLSSDPYKIIDMRKIDGREGKMPLLFMLLPAGELNIAPVEGTANGRLVFDLCIHQIGRIHEPIALDIEDSKIVGICGGVEAHTLRQYLETYGDQNAYFCPAEASIGVNAKAIARGVQREDKNILGTMHFGIGTNIDVGGSILSNIHMDGVILHPTLFVDGVERIREGRFLVPLDRLLEK